MIIDGHSHLFQIRWSCDNLPRGLRSKPVLRVFGSLTNARSGLMVDALGEVDWQSLTVGLGEIGAEKFVFIVKLELR